MDSSKAAVGLIVRAEPTMDTWPAPVPTSVATSNASTVVSSLVFLIVMLPVPKAMTSLNSAVRFAVGLASVALSAGTVDTSVGAVTSGTIRALFPSCLVKRNDVERSLRP